MPPIRTAILAGAALLLGVLQARAQQSIFNVPTGDIVAYRHAYLQQQVELSDAVSAGTTLDYGLGKGWEIGANLLNYGLGQLKATPEDPENPDLPALATLNAQKSFNLVKEKLMFCLGTQQGVGLGPKALGRYHSWNWAMFEVQDVLIDNLEVVLGAYQAHWNLVGNGDKGHAIVGFEYQVTKPVHLSAEWMGGDNQIGGTVLGVTVFAIPKVPVAVGYRIPNTSRSRQGVTVQLSAQL